MLTITQERLDNFKKMYPDNIEIQNLTLEKLSTTSVNKNLKLSNVNNFEISESKITANSCELAITTVVIDCVLIATGLVGLKAGISGKKVRLIYKIIEPIFQELSRIVAEMKKDNADIPRLIYEMIYIIFSFGFFSQILKVLLDELSWWEYLIISAEIIATLTAAILTGGVSLIAEITILLISAIWLFIDIDEAITQCSL